MYNLSHIGANVRFRVHNPDIGTVARAVVERVKFDAKDGLKPVVRPDPELYTRRADPFNAKVKKYLKQASPLSFDEFLACYKGRKLRVYQNAVEKILREGLTEANIRKWSYLNPFTKAEKMNITEKPDPTPRVIQPRHPCFNVLLGCYVKPLEHMIYKAIDEMNGETTIYKGMNAEKSGESIAKTWFSYSDPAAIPGDASKFDRQVDQIALEHEHVIYKHPYRRVGACSNYKISGDYKRRKLGEVRHVTIEQIIKQENCDASLASSIFDSLRPCAASYEHKLKTFRDRDGKEFQLPMLDQLLRLCEVNRGFCRGPDGMFQYTNIGSRVSGDMTTAVGNIVIMNTVCRGYIKSKPYRVSLVNNGDDSVFIMERCNVADFMSGLPQYFLECGFQMKCGEPVYTLEQIEFCQTQPVEVKPGKWIMIRDPRVCITKDSHSIKAWTDEITHQRLMKSISDCGLALTSGVPVLQAFYDSLAYDVKPIVNEITFETGMFNLAKGMKPQDREIQDCARVSFYKAFGINPYVQKSVERVYQNMVNTWSEPRATEPRPTF